MPPAPYRKEKMSFIVDGVTTTPEGKIKARRIGEYPNHDEAVTAAKQAIDSFLYHAYRKGAGYGISAKKLLALYQRSGEVPLILRSSEITTEVSRFDYLEYAAQRCEDLCRSEKDK
jgi:hypothetical protein